jgi:hypothetical protein
MGGGIDLQDRAADFLRFLRGYSMIAQISLTSGSNVLSRLGQSIIAARRSTTDTLEPRVHGWDDGCVRVRIEDVERRENIKAL